MCLKVCPLIQSYVVFSVLLDLSYILNAILLTCILPIFLVMTWHLLILSAVYIQMHFRLLLIMEASTINMGESFQDYS